MVNDDYIRKHYKKVAHNFGESGLSTIQDPFIRESETLFFINEIEQYIIKLNKKQEDISILDLGCGNGFLLNEIRNKFPLIKLFGLEFTADLFDIARGREIENCQIFLGDMREEIPIEEKFDMCLTERALINLLSWKQQKSALINIFNSLKTKGEYLMSESFLESWTKLNLARREVKLEDLPQSKHNLYLSESTVKGMRTIGFKEIETKTARHYLSTHFYVSRVFHQYTKPEGAKIKNSHMVSFFNQALPPGIGTYSPIQFRKFLKE